MPQFDYQQLCHFVLPEQGTVGGNNSKTFSAPDTTWKSAMPNIFRMEFRKTVFPAAQMQLSRLEIRSLFDMRRSVPTFPKIRFCRYQVILPAYGFSMRTVISVSQTSHPVWSATLPTAIIPIP